MAAPATTVRAWPPELMKALVAGPGDVRRVDRAGLQRLDGRRSGVERRDLQLGRPEVLTEEALFLGDDRRGVRQVGEIAQPHDSRCGTSGLGVSTTGRHTERCNDGDDGKCNATKGSRHQGLQILRATAGRAGSHLFRGACHSYVTVGVFYSLTLLVK